MNSKPILVCLLMVTMAFSGCIGGDEEPIPNLNENEPSLEPELNDWTVHFAGSSDDLPVCDQTTLGRLYYVESDNNFINEFAQIDKIIPQSDKKIEIFGLEILKDIKKEIGINKYNEYGKNVDWKSFSECLARKMWSSFTPKQMMNPSKETDNLGEKFFEDCMMETSGIKL